MAGSVEGTWSAAASGARPGSVWLELRAGTVTGSTGCNRLRGPYTVDEHGHVAFGAVATTQMAGSPEAMALERRVLDGLADGARLTPAGALLLGADGNGLGFDRAPAPSASGAWDVVAVHVPSREAIVSTGREAVATIADGALTVVTASGAVDGSWQELGDDGAITVELTALPDDAHPDDVDLVDGLRRAVGWQREGERLRLVRDDGGIAATLTPHVLR